MMLSTISIYNSDVMIVIMTYTIYNIIIVVTNNIIDMYSLD